VTQAVKVVDLLQHSAELGNMEALYTLSQVVFGVPSLTHVSALGVTHLLPSFLPHIISYQTQHWPLLLSYNPCAKDRQIATSQAYGMLSSTSTGYHGVTLVDQRRLNFIIHLPQTGRQGCPDGPWIPFTGAGLEPRKAVNAR